MKIFQFILLKNGAINFLMMSTSSLEINSTLYPYTVWFYAYYRFPSYKHPELMLKYHISCKPGHLICMKSVLF